MPQGTSYLPLPFPARAQRGRNAQCARFLYRAASDGIREHDAPARVEHNEADEQFVEHGAVELLQAGDETVQFRASGHVRKQVLQRRFVVVGIGAEDFLPVNRDEVGPQCVGADPRRHIP